MRELVDGYLPLDHYGVCRAIDYLLRLVQLNAIGNLPEQKKKENEIKIQKTQEKLDRASRRINR